MTPFIFLILNLALGFYNVGTIWAMEVDIFRSWKLIGNDFHTVQEVHWKKLPYWIFTPVALALIGSIELFWYHPVGSLPWAIWGVFLTQAISLMLTAIFWGQWQAKLSKDPLGSKSPYLTKILKTHWARTLLINAYAFILLAWVIILFR
ncbi:MAG TPA: hypothetical protein VHZ04_03260 [Candidatus Paceibacterota bacterium]|jgi:hypothetical protein|nr:hypothetical protein [Candidatus Paceibacterota bacterium]